MDTTVLKNNNQIIKEAREAFKGKWGKVFLTQIIAQLLYLIIVLTIFIGFVPTLLLHLLNPIISKVSMSLVFLFSMIAGVFGWLFLIIWLLVALIFFGRIWKWLTVFILKTSRGEDVSYSDFKTIFEGFNNFKEIKASIFNKKQLKINLFPAFTILLTTASILAGSLLLVIPGIIISLMLAIVPYILAEGNNISPIDVLKRSSSIMDGYKMKLFWCYVKLIPLGILCTLPLGIGLLWFVPYLSFVLAKFYDAHK